MALVKVTVNVKPDNGLGITGLGHLSHGEQELEVTSEQLVVLKKAEGLSVKEAASKKPAAPKIEKPADEAELNTAIRDAIATLDTSAEALWTQTDGVPTVEAVAAVLGYSITAAERNAAQQV